MSSVHYLLLILAFTCMTGCSSCSQSGRRGQSSTEAKGGHRPKDRTVIKMEREGGVDHLWMEVNGHRFLFVFDTGASSICISSAVANVMLEQRTLSRADFREAVFFHDATGRVSEGQKIILRSVRIGDRSLKDVEAIIIDGAEAPLLLGRSALDQFGRITIDTRKGEVILE
jgi:aspartyl protease family protein